MSADEGEPFVRRPLKAWVILGSKAPKDLRAQDYVGDYEKLPTAQSFKVGQWLEWRVMRLMVDGRAQSVFCVCVEVPV